MGTLSKIPHLAVIQCYLSFFVSRSAGFSQGTSISQCEQWILGRNDDYKSQLNISSWEYNEFIAEDRPII